MSDQEFKTLIRDAIARLEHRVDGLEAKVDFKIEELRQALTSRIDGLDTRLLSLEKAIYELVGARKSRDTLWARVAVGASIIAVIIAGIALFIK